MAGLASSAEMGDRSTAVLPFVNMSGDAANEYFSDGLTEELLNVLAKVPGLKVTARTSAFHFKGKDTPIAEQAIIGLGVGAAARGLRPVCDLMFMDFIGVAMDQIFNQAAKMKYMFGGNVSVPLTITTAGGHNNLATGAGAPSVTTLNTLTQKMMEMTGLNTSSSKTFLNLMPKFILVPPALRGTVLELLGSTSYTVANGNSGVKNIWENGLSPVIDAELGTSGGGKVDTGEGIDEGEPGDGGNGDDMGDTQRGTPCCKCGGNPGG